MSTTLPTTLGAGPFAAQTRGLTKRYGRALALSDVDLLVPEGAVYVLVGANGAGKSTTLKVLVDLVRPSGGTAEVLGLSPRTHGHRVRAQIGYVSERLDWGYGWMRVDRLLEHHATYFPAWDRGYASHLAKVFSLRLDRKFRSLSKGEARRVHLTMALAHRPPLLILDEPTDGLDPIMLDETIGLLVDHMAETPTTVLISTHQIHDLDRLADHVGVMRDGQLIMQVPRDNLHRMLRGYRADIPENWTGAPGLSTAVLRRAGVGREIQWTVWGDEREVVAHLTCAGAYVREVTALSLAEATRTILNPKFSP